MSEDFMPLLGWDYIEFWVGNAKQAAYFYEHGLGFTRTAYAGPETGVRDRASYVLEQGDIRFVAHLAAARGSRDREAPRPPRRRRQGDRAHGAGRDRGVPRRRCSAARAASTEPSRAEDEFGSLETSAIATYGDTVHTFVNRSDYAGPFKPGYVSVSSNGQAARRRPDEHRPRRRQRRARAHEPLGRVLRARVRDDRDDPLLRRGHLDRVLGADVQGDGGRRRARSSSRSTSRPRASGRARSRSTSTSTAAPARSTSRSRRRTSSRPSSS